LPDEKARSEAAHKAWGRRRARKAVATRKKNMLHTKRSADAKKEIAWRKKMQKWTALSLREWWKREHLGGSPSKPKPLKCEVCGDTERWVWMFIILIRALKKVI
jgi:hypothetical protein